MPDNKTLILGAAIGYSADQITPFLTSLRNSGYRGDIALLVDPRLARGFSRLPLFEGVILLKTAQWIPYRFNLVARKKYLRSWRRFQKLLWLLMRLLAALPLDAARGIRLQALIGRYIYPPSESRYLRYFEFLSTHQYSRVLISDVRDVLFQQDPFPWLPSTGLALSMEDRHLTIANETHNSNWVRLAYGNEMLLRIGQNRISCSGVTYGDGSSIKSYLRLMAGEILGLNRTAVALGVGGTDQGIHNVLLWTGRLGSCSHLETMTSPVATLCTANEMQFRLSADGKMLNQDDSIISVVHQYDRWPQLRESLLRTLTTPPD